jgi:hypothetical protein
MRRRREEGQVLPIVALTLVVLLGISAFAIDVGYAYYAKRQLQSAADAAALAGAQDLPNASTAISTAASYAQANVPPNVSYSFTYDTSCTNTAVIATGCSASVNPNQLTVHGTASTQTWFARIFGIDHFDISAHANACSPCSSTPVDIVIAIDRTGSMCDSTNWNGCIDLNNAKAGVRTMLGILNPPYAQVGMVAFPPVQTTSTSPCAAPYTASQGFTGYDAPNRGYVTDTLNGDYKKNGALNTSSGLYLHTAPGGSSSCIQAGGSTSYTEALRQAQAELDAHGRPNVPDVIVFLTDGEANMGSVYGVNDKTYPPGNPDDQQPCHSAINIANQYKAQGTIIYSIGYALGNKYCTAGDWPVIPAQPAQYDRRGRLVSPAVPAHYCDPSDPDERSGCYHSQGSTPESPAITSNNTLQQIASPGDFYNQPSAGQLNTIFAAIATDIGSGSSRLVDDGF